MGEVTRYESTLCDGADFDGQGHVDCTAGLVEQPDGDWVLYDDHHREIERLEKLVMSLKLYPPDVVQERIDSAIALNSAIRESEIAGFREALEIIAAATPGSWVAEIARAALPTDPHVPATSPEQNDDRNPA